MKLQSTVHIRALWAERIARSTGIISREQIATAFNTSVASASAAIAYLKHHNPKALTFDTAGHTYRWNDGVPCVLAPPQWFMEIAVRVMTTQAVTDFEASQGRGPKSPRIGGRRVRSASLVAAPDCPECGFSSCATWCRNSPESIKRDTTRVDAALAGLKGRIIPVRRVPERSPQAVAYRTASRPKKKAAKGGKK